MKVTVLAENSIGKTHLRDVKPEHGLSLFIEFEDKKILFDLGQSDLFIRNAEKMGIDLSQVDYLFISHGHYDHGGGLQYFLKNNNKAKIYLHKKATNRFYTKILGFIPFYVGLDQKTISQNSGRMNFILRNTQIEDNIVLLEGFPEIFPQSDANKTLFEKSDKKMVPDKFKHEIALLLFDKEEVVLFSGCSHSGIINIIDEVKLFTDDKRIKAIFGGFHIYNPINKKSESPCYINKLTEAMDEADAVFYAGHCTGEANYFSIKKRLGRRIQTMSTGEVIEV